MHENREDNKAAIDNPALPPNAEVALRPSMDHARRVRRGVMGYYMPLGKAVDDIPADVVQRIFHQYAESMNLRQVARQLNEDGVKTSPRAAGKAWTAQRVRHILRKHGYVGRWSINKIHKSRCRHCGRGGAFTKDGAE